MSGSYILSNAVNSSAPGIMSLAGQMHAVDAQKELGNRELGLRENQLLSDNAFRQSELNQRDKQFDRQFKFDERKFEELNKRAAELHEYNKKRVAAETGLITAQTGQVNAATAGQTIRNEGELVKQTQAALKPVAEYIQRELNAATTGKDENGNPIYDEAKLINNPQLKAAAETMNTLAYGGMLASREHATHGVNTRVKLEPIDGTTEWITGFTTKDGLKPLTRNQGKYPDDADVVRGKPSEILRSGLGGAMQYLGISSAQNNATVLAGLDEFARTANDLTGGAFIPKANSQGLKANAMSALNSGDVGEQQLNLARGNAVTAEEQKQSATDREVQKRKQLRTEGENAQDTLAAEIASQQLDELATAKATQSQERAIKLMWSDVFEGDKGVLENLGDFLFGEDAAWDTEADMRKDVAATMANPDNMDRIAKALQLPQQKRKWTKDDWYRVVELIKESRENGRGEESIGLLNAGLITGAPSFAKQLMGTKPKVGEL